MPTTLTREKLPISDAQAAEALAIAEDVCRDLGVLATLELSAYDDPDLTPSRVALLQVTLDDDVTTDLYLKTISILGRALEARGLKWPDVPFEQVVR